MICHFRVTVKGKKKKSVRVKERETEREEKVIPDRGRSLRWDRSL